MKQSDRCDCRRQTPWANLLRSPGGATWSVLGVGGAPSGFFFFGGALAWSGLYSCRLERKDTTLKDTVIKAFSEDERFDAVPQRQASSYASRGRGCCWTTSGPLVCLRPGSCVPVLCISWHSWGGGGGEKKQKMEQIVTMKEPEETWGCCQLGDRTHNVVPNLGWERSNIGSWQDWSVSLSFSADAEALDSWRIRPK